MNITSNQLHQTLQHLFPESRVEKIEEEQAALLNASCGDYHWFGALKIFGSFTSETEQMQAIGLSLTFTDQEGEALDLQHKTQVDIAVLSIELQSYLDWGTLLPCKTPLDTIEMTLSRSFHTSAADLALANSDDLRRELVTALLHLSGELEYIAPVLQHFASTEEFNMHLIEPMLRPVDQTAGC